jgi:hypothetical protein
MHWGRQSDREIGAFMTPDCFSESRDDVTLFSLERFQLT